MTTTTERPKRHKPRKNITLDPATARQLAKASDYKRISESACIELALAMWFRAEALE
jgi:hypothetical protein